MTDFALIRLPDGSAWLGEGPFTSLSAAPSSGGAFYINDFELTDRLPWKQPARLHALTLENHATLLHVNGAQLPVIRWAKPATEWFKMAFRRIRREVLSQRIEKMVPVLTEVGTLASGSPLKLIERILDAPSNTWAYAHLRDGAGFLGATPELLFRTFGDELETMALAGTAKPGSSVENFENDVKEIEEHEIVVRYLTDRLSQVGAVRREGRELCRTYGLTHFHSRITVKLFQKADAALLVPFLHPTPAVGCLPRDESTLDRLCEYRRQLKVPSFFGAPFGFIEPGGETTHVVVAIRGVAFDGNHVSLPSGCGIVGGSAFDHEWRELRLKREAVLRLLGLQS